MLRFVCFVTFRQYETYFSPCIEEKGGLHMDPITLQSLFLPFNIQQCTFNYEVCCDMSQNDTIGKIELNPSFVLSSDNTNCKNDIQ